MSTFWNRIREPLKSFGNRSTAAQRSYGAYLLWRASNLHGRDQHYAALVELCRALRQIRNPTITETHFEKLCSIVRAACYQNGSLAAHSQNRLHHEFLVRPEARNYWSRFQAEALPDRLRLRYHRDDAEAERQGYMMILKSADESSGERGVLLLKYNYNFEAFAAVYDLGKVLTQYRVVLEPSWSFNYLPSLFLYAGRDVQGVIQSQHDEDYEFITRCHPSLRPVRLGASDWVDSDLFIPKGDRPREYDVVMVAAWLRIKRHHALFRALAKLRPRKLRTALIGYPMDLTLKDIRRQMRRYGVEDQCETFESVPPTRVAEIVANSKVAILFSKQEGNPKAPYEALFCDTPIILHRQNVGLRSGTANEQTGILADDRDLPEAITYVVDHPEHFRPRDWALAHSGYAHATRQLNHALREMAKARGEPWTRDIVPKVNRPNLRYKCDRDRLALEPAYHQLGRFLRASPGGCANG